MHFYQGAVSYKDLMQMPFSEILFLGDSAVKINKLETEAANNQINNNRFNRGR